MSKTLTVVYLLAALPTLAHAQAGRVELSVGGGVAIPIGGNVRPSGSASTGFSKNYKSGYTVGAGLGLALVPQFLFSLNLDYSSFPLDGAAYLGGTAGTVSGGQLSILSFGASARFEPLSGPLPVVPYLVAGASGLKLSNVEVTSSGPSFTQTVKDTRYGLAQDLAVQAGAGVLVRAGTGARLFVEVRAAIGTFSQASYVPVRAGLAIRL